MQLSPGLHRFTSGLGGAHQPVNSYLLQTVAGTVLIDPAGDCTPDKLSASPEAILITHLQEEHVAGCVHYPGVPVYIPAGAEYLCEGAAAYRARDTKWQAPWDWQTLGNYEGHLGGARNERAPHQPLPFAGIVREGDELFGLRAWSTPGHGKHALSFTAHIRERSFAFCGDLIYGDGQLWNWFDCDWDYGLQTGQRTLLDSARRLQNAHARWLLPAHGPPLVNAAAALDVLCSRLEKVLAQSAESGGEAPSHAQAAINFPERDSPARGWRELSPHLHQWKSGNCAALLSRTGHALLIDDGLCYWKMLPERAAHHRRVMADMKRALGVSQIEIVIPTHYHGDHTENIPDLVTHEGAQVYALDVVAEAIEHPERFNLCCPLPWYGTEHDVVEVHRHVAGGTRLSWHEYELEIFHLGGQTFYHAGIAAEVDGHRVLFVGDAIGGLETECEPVLCYNDCEPSTRGWSYALERMMEREPELLVCGHGVAVRDPMPLLRAKHEKWRQRLRDYAALDARNNLRLFFDPFFNASDALP